MNLSALITEARRRLDDRAAPFLWSDDDLTLFLNEAEKEAAERAQLLRDSVTPSICTIALVTGQREYVLDARVIDVEIARVRGQRDSLTRRTPTQIDCDYHNPGIARGYAVYEQSGKRVLVLDRDAPDPSLIVAPTYYPFVDLTVYRRPLNQMVDSSDTPEIDPARHLELIHWVAFLAYSTRDSDAGDAQKANTADGLFTLAFGEKIDANVKRKQLRHRPPVTRPERY